MPLMEGLMQDVPLLIHSVLDFAEIYHPNQEIVTKTIEGPIHRYNFKKLASRAKQLVHVLKHLGVSEGDRVATMAWNTHRHMEAYFAVSGMGAVLHTINPRLFPEQIEYIANHAEDSVLLFDLTFLPLVEKLHSRFKTIKHYVLMTDLEHMPKSSPLTNLHCYEFLVQHASNQFKWPTFDEKIAASLCYTSGTTGNPKGVLFSHRSTILHSFGVCYGDGLGLNSNDSALIIVPLFHASGWGIAYGAAMTGAKLVFPGASLDGKSVYDLLLKEECNVSLGVPTVWLMLFQYLDANPRLQASDLKLRTVIIGGSAAPRYMIKRFIEEFQSDVMHGWGMTELSPRGTNGNLKRKHKSLPLEQRLDRHVKQGRGLYGVELKIVDEEGKELPRDGVAFGNLKVRGPWVARAYFKEAGTLLDEEGWFDTGDVATIDPDGYLQITDRSKDVIKSGGEWISSIELENTAMGHPAVQEAAVIGVRHSVWQERPLLVVVCKSGSVVTAGEILKFFEGKVAKWWIPDDVAFVTELPHSATGKLLKNKLREQFQQFQFSTDKPSSNL
jgi:fatty-acyl-CoA synthase